MNNFKDLTRAYTLPMSIAPFLVAFCCAIKVPILPDSSFLGNAILLLIGILLVHMATNAFDDYIDVKRQINIGLRIFEINFKCKRKAATILSGAFTMKEVRNIIITMLVVAFLIGMYFVSLRGGSILFYMLLALLLSAFYPVSSRYGLSEIVVGVVFGPILINASYYALCGQFDAQVFNFSIASGIITTILLITHSLMDYEFDIEAHKNTLPVVLKDKNLTINIISILILISYFILIYTSFKYGTNKFIFLPIIVTLFISKKLILSLYEYIQIKDVKFVPQWYFGPMENFENYLKDNFAYFMFRFYLARNLSLFFNLSLALACFLVFYPLETIDFRGMNFIWNHFIY